MRPLPQEVRDGWLTRHLPYRLASIDALRWLADRVDRLGALPEALRGLHVTADSRAVDPKYWTNNVVDAGLAHCRGMVHFLGLTTSRSNEDARTRWYSLAKYRHDDDLKLRDLVEHGRPITEDDLRARCVHAEMLYTLTLTTGAVAHFIESGVPRSADEPDGVNTRWVLEATRAIPDLVKERLYDELQIPVPSGSRFPL